MFEDKNKKDGAYDLGQNKELRPSDIPVHTMLGDLDELEHPKKSAPLPIDRVPQPAIQANLTDAQKTSPFLNQLQNSGSPSQDSSRLKIHAEAEVPQPPPLAKKIDVSEVKKDLFIQPEKKLTEVPKKEAGQDRAIGKLIGAIAIVLVIIVLGGGGYYFWITKQKNPQNNSTSEPIVETPEPIAVEPPKEISKFSLEKPNYLQIDPAATDLNALKNAVVETVKEVEKENVTGLVEFIAVDKENNPIGFSTFSKKIGLVFSKNILTALKDTFSLFVYKDGDNYRLGVSLDYKEGTNLKNLMLLEEPRLLTNLMPLFLEASYVPIKVQRFSNNTYKDMPIRYLNIVSPEYLSIDYAVSSKALLIGTTRLTTKMIIDRLNPGTAEIPQKTK